MQKMKCLVDGFEYPPGQRHALGDFMDVEDSHVQLFVIVGKAEKTTSVSHETLTRVEEPRVKRQYNKRTIN